MREAILIIDADRYERESKAPIAIASGSEYSLDWLEAESIENALLRLQDEARIVGVISALKFPDSAGIEGIIRLNQQCQVLGIPFQICISRKKDTPSEEELETLRKSGIEYEINDRGKDWESAVESIVKKLAA
jgi:hypothetical protein